MKCIAQFFKLNYDFSPEFAEAHHDGKESENNRMFDWEDELEVTSKVKDIEVVENSIYTLKGELKGNAFSEEIPNMLVFNILGENDEVTLMACSHSIVNKYEITKAEEVIHLKVFLEEREPLTNPIPGIYIAVQDFPKFLRD